MNNVTHIMFSDKCHNLILAQSLMYIFSNYFPLFLFSQVLVYSISYQRLQILRGTSVLSYKPHSWMKFS